MRNDYEIFVGDFLLKRLLPKLSINERILFNWILENVVKDPLSQNGRKFLTRR
jgi:hypothetical protein